MSKPDLDRSTAALVTLLVLLAWAEPAWSVVVPGTGTGSIPDSTEQCGNPAATSREISFAVSGVTSPVHDVDVMMTIDHTWVGDVEARLVAPTGASHVLFGNTGWKSGTDSCGDSSNLDGTYTFDDSATPVAIPPGSRWWIEAEDRGDTEILPPDAYRSSIQGSAGLVTPFETLAWSPFNGLTPAEANGTWTLQVTDWGRLFTGSVTAASLGINEDCLSPLLLCCSTVTFDVSETVCRSVIVFSIVVEGPSGHFTLAAGHSVEIGNDFVVGPGGRLTIIIDPTLDPLAVALEHSAILGKLDRLLDLEQEQ